MTSVVDASVALKWFLRDEPLGAEALAMLRGETALIAPDLVIAETCNAVWRWTRLGRIGRDQANEIAAILPGMFDSLLGAGTLAQQAVAMAAELDHPVCDCLYLALAEARGVGLVTADERLLAKLRGTRWEASAMALAEYPIAG